MTYVGVVFYPARMIFFSYLTDFGYFPLNFFLKVAGGFERGVDGFSYFN
jgi:hypothetical protein